MFKGFTLTISSIILSALISILTLNAQTSTINNAESLYKKEVYDKALPLYIDIVRKDSKNAIYNHRLGVCYYETATNYELAEKYLKVASKGNISISNFYLGKVCMHLYKFDEAITYFELYQKKGKKTSDEYADAERSIAQCNTLSRMLLATEEIDIIAQMVVNKSKFFEYYDLSKESGLLYQTKDIFKDVDSSFIFFMPERADRLYYPKLSDDKSNSNIYYRDKLIGTYGPEIALNNNVNSEANELFPFQMSDGITFYFSSQDHASIGGFDIFVTRYSTESKSFLPPANLGMPFNSPANDYLYIIDEQTNTGWFASDRNNKPGEVTIYKFRSNNSKKTVQLQDDELRNYARIPTNLNVIEAKLPTKKTTATQTQRSEVKTVKTEEFKLILSDKVIYTAVSDFKNKQALESFLESTKLSHRKDSLEKQVAQLRQNYASLPEDQISAVRTKIIAIEDEILYLEPNISKKINEAKMIELQHLDQIKIEDVPAVSESKPERITEPFFIVKGLSDIYKNIFTQSEIDTLTNLDNQSIIADKKCAFLNVAYDAIESNDQSLTNNTSFWNELRSIDSKLITANDGNTKMLTTNIRQSVSVYMMESSKNIYSKFVLYFLKINELYNKSDNKTVKEDLFSFMKTSEYYRSIALNFFDNPKKQADTVAIKSLRDELDKSIRLMEFSFVFYYENKDRQSRTVIDSTSQKTVEVIPIVEPEAEQQNIVPSENKIKNSEPIENSNKLIYKVQLGVFSNAPDESILNRIPEVLIIPSADGSRVKMYAGKFDTEAQARDFATEYASIGFAGAFVVPFLDNKPLTKSELTEFLKKNK